MPVRYILAGLLLSLSMLWGCGTSEEYEKAAADGRKFFKQQKWGQAEKAFAQALTHEPDIADTLDFHARSLARTQRFSDAFKKYSTLIRNSGFDEFDTERKGRVFREMGALLLRQAMDRGETPFFFRAKKYFTQSLAAVPNAYASLFGKGITLYGLDKFYQPGSSKESAYHYLKRCSQMAPSRPEGLYFYALCHVKDKRLSSLEALRIYQRGVTLYGSPDALKPDKLSPTAVFETTIKAIDGGYLGRLLHELIPLLAKVDPAKRKVDLATARDEARQLYNAYVRLDKARPLSSETVRWIQGERTPPAGTGTGTGPGPAVRPPTYKPAGMRPSLSLISPAKPRIVTAAEEISCEVAVTDDRKGSSLRVWLNDTEINPRFDLRFFANIPLGKIKGHRTVAKFRQKLAAGENRFRIRASDTDGLNSDDVSLSVVYKPATIYAVVVGAPGPKGMGAYAADDARRFMEYVSAEVGVTAANRVLLAEKGASPLAVRKALEKIGAALFEDDVVIFYFAGLGTSLNARSGRQWGLVFRDFAGGTNQGFLPLSYFGGYMAKHRLRKFVMILDTSFTGPAGQRSRTNQGAPGALEKGVGVKVRTRLGVLPAHESKLTLLCAADGRGSALEIETRNRQWQSGGLFTTILLRGLNRADGNRDGVVTLDEIRPFLTDQVSFFASRQGHAQVPLVLGSPSGEALFN